MLQNQTRVINAIKAEKERSINVYKNYPKVIFLSYDTYKLLFNMIFDDELLGMKVYVVDNIKEKKFVLSHGAF